MFQSRFFYSLTGTTGTGKTSVLLLLAAATAMGTSVAGREVKKGRVVYLAGENPDDVQMRWLASGHRSVAEQLALGISPTQALVGQMSHLSYVASGPGGVGGALKAIGSSVVGLAGSLPAVTAAIVASGAVAAIYVPACIPTANGQQRIWPSKLT